MRILVSLLLVDWLVLVGLCGWMSLTVRCEKASCVAGIAGGEIDEYDAGKLYTLLVFLFSQCIGV